MQPSPEDLSTVTVLLFAHYRDLAEDSSIELQVPTGATVRKAVALLRGLPGLDSLPSEPTVAVNREYVSLDHSLAPNDEIALIPPVAGGLFAGGVE
jgi:molybdopterin converting factor subunit 1